MIEKMSMLSRGRAGFTIVELLIVIVVVAVLAAISVVAYTGIQQRARDSKRKDDVAKIVKAVKLWSADTGGDFTAMSAGSNGHETGWFNGEYAPYPSVASVLSDAGYLNEDVRDPINRMTMSDTFAYMITPCGSTGATTRVILARLENPPSQTPSEQLGTECTNSSFLNYTTNYQMNYAVMIEL